MQGDRDILPRDSGDPSPVPEWAAGRVADPLRIAHGEVVRLYVTSEPRRWLLLSGERFERAVARTGISSYRFLLAARDLVEGGSASFEPTSGGVILRLADEVPE